MRKDIYGVILTMGGDIKINKSAIARQYGCDPRTVARYYDAKDESPNVRKKRKIKHTMDGYENIVLKKYFEEHAPAIAIFNVIKGPKYGYKGSYSTIKRFIHTNKIEKEQEATIHFETAKGEQCQIDWKESLKLKSSKGETYEINIFLAILGYSRAKYIELTLDKTQPTLFKCLANTIRYYGGTPHEFLFDNMKTVVDQSRTQFREPVYNERFVQFAKDAGFIAKSCVAFRPKTKGKVETVAKIMNRLKAYNDEFDTIEELIEIVNKLRDEINLEIHATTHEKPIERLEKEKEYLNPEPNYEILEAYFNQKPITRKVPNDFLVSYQGKRYSVPPKYIGKIVTITQEGTKLHIYYNSILIAKHVISTKNTTYDRNHYVDGGKSSFKDEDALNKAVDKNLSLYDEL